MDPITPERLKNRMVTALLAKRGKVRVGAHEEGTVFNIRRIDAGKLMLPTGRICVADAYWEDFQPLNRLVPPGEYAVELVIAELPEDLPFGNARCAFLTVTISAGTPNSWESVTAVAPSFSCFKDEAPNRFVQEGGTGVFSPEAGAVHSAHLAQQHDAQLNAMEKALKSFGCGEWGNFAPGPESANMVISSGGFGDGHYHCFAGMTQAGRVARFVIDFGIADPE